MTFVIDTVGRITLPDGTQADGVILTVPAGTPPKQARAAVKDAGRLWAGRVTLHSAETEASQ